MKVNRATLTLAACAGLAGAAPAQPGPVALQALLDERAVVRAADTIDAAVDAKDWALARSLFAARVTVDFSSLGAGPPREIASDDLIGAWRSNLWPGKDSLHLRTNHRVAFDGMDDDVAILASHGYAWNAIGERMWEVWGTYEHRFLRTPEGWRVTHFTFRMTRERGDRGIAAEPRR